jgi:8-oxo-dGTP pyrophosphatase MutT (NUDIX family)
MDYIARWYILNHEGEILLVKMDEDAPWALPGWHVEPWETPYSTLQREVREELWIQITILWTKNEFYESYIRPYPLPISIHEIQYEHRSWEWVKRLEFWYFAHIRDNDEIAVDNKELVAAQWFDPEDIVAMQWGHEIYRSVQEVLTQNRDLLDLLL